MASNAPGRGSSGRAPAGVLLRAAELAAADQPFVLATVVSVQRPTSAKPGAHGIIHPDRTVEGWVGGSCARPVVIREAIRALVDGQPRLLRLSPSGTSEGRRADGVVEYLMTCHSGGTLEIFVEPHLPVPALWVAGTTPIAAAMVELGATAGFRVTAIDPDAHADTFPSAEHVVASADLAGLPSPPGPPFVVVATQGQWDEDAVEAALRRDASYVGLVASPKRAAAVRDFLRGRAVPEAAIARLKAPAGLDLGARTPEEVAISILAELVQVRRRPDARPAAGPVAHEPIGVMAQRSDAVAEPPALAVRATVLLDPVCGMEVEPDDMRYRAEHDGVVYAFCARACKTRFEQDPASFAGAAAAR